LRAASPLASAPGASTALARYGALSSAAPASSHDHCSIGPQPAPPYFSGMVFGEPELPELAQTAGRTASVAISRRTH
jgi:hypothetical protein